MYKKIYHTILEEHFEHPAILPNTIMPSEHAQLPGNTMTEKTMEFRMNSRTLWSKYVWGLMNYGIALNNKVPSIEFIKARAVKNADELGKYITPYYGDVHGAEFARLLGNFIKIGTDVIEIIKDGGTVDGGEAIWGPAVIDLSKFLSTLNPTNWPEAAVSEYFTKMARFWLDEIKTRAKQDWASNDASLNELSQLVITGKGINGGNFTSLADVFSRGIIAQFPNKFVG